MFVCKWRTPSCANCEHVHVYLAYRRQTGTVVTRLHTFQGVRMDSIQTYCSAHQHVRNTNTPQPLSIAWDKLPAKSNNLVNGNLNQRGSFHSHLFSHVHHHKYHNLAHRITSAACQILWESPSHKLTNFLVSVLVTHIQRVFCKPKKLGVCLFLPWQISKKNHSVINANRLGRPRVYGVLGEHMRHLWKMHAHIF